MAGIIPSTPSGSSANNLFQPPPNPMNTPADSSLTSNTPVSAASSNNTFLMPSSPVKGRRGSSDTYKPKLVRTIGQKPACLVNASVTYCGNNQIYAFGGFDQYTDEVYNHVLKLDLGTLKWSLVDNYGDIPGVRMGHTATLWQGDKLLIYGGENEHRTYLSDVVILDLKTAHWTQPSLKGPIPKGRARHAAVIHDDKLFVVGGLTGINNYVLDDICYLDLKTWTWSRSWRFVGRFDHTAWIWGGRIWVFGGLGEDMERGGEIWWLDLKGSPAFDAQPLTSIADRQTLSGSYGQGGRALFNTSQTTSTAPSGYAANSSSIQANSGSSVTLSSPVAPGSISSLKFVSGPDLPSQAAGTHFHVYSSGALLDFVTPASTIRPSECNLSAFDLESLRWQRLAEGSEIFNPGYRWHYCAMNEGGTKCWLLGCATDPPGAANTVSGEEYLSDILSIDLRKFGLLGNSMASEGRPESSKLPTSDRYSNSTMNGLGADLGAMFDQPPESGSGADFIVTAERDDNDESNDDASSASNSETQQHQQQFLVENSTSLTTSRPIHVHKLILQSRWPHFARLYASQMAEFHTKKMHIPEPYSVVRAFLYYLYTDSIAPHTTYCQDLSDVAGLLVLANVYDMPRLRLLSVHRLARELDVEHAASIWDRAGTANEPWLRRRASAFCLLHWGRIVRTPGFRRLSRTSLMELCEEVDMEGRVVGGEELEVVGGLGGGRLGVGGLLGGGYGAYNGRGLKGADGRSPSTAILLGEEMDDGDGDGEADAEDEDMG